MQRHVPLIIALCILIAGCLAAPGENPDEEQPKQDPLPPRTQNASFNGSLEPVAPVCPAVCPPASWRDSVPDLADRTVLSVNATLTWEVATGADEELRIQVYHVYPSGEVDVGKELANKNGTSPLQVDYGGQIIPVTGSGEIRIIIHFAFRESPLGDSYQLQADQDFQIDVELLSRPLLPEDLQVLDPPQKEREN